MSSHTPQKKPVPALVSAGVIAALTMLGLYQMLTHTGGGILIVSGVRNLKHFTVDSNLLLGLVCLAYIVLTAAGVTARHPAVWLLAERALYVATVSVALTFTVVMLFFVPQTGLAPMIQGANLWFHLIDPVLAVVTFCAFHRDRPIPLRETAAALAPTVVYAVYYTAVVLVRGAHFPDTDWYGFTRGGVTGSIATAAGILLATWLLALALRLAAGGRISRKTADNTDNTDNTETMNP